MGGPIRKNIPPQFLYIFLIIWLPPLCFLAFLLPSFPLLNTMSPARYKRSQDGKPTTCFIALWVMISLYTWSWGTPLRVQCQLPSFVICFTSYCIVYAPSLSTASHINRYLALHKHLQVSTTNLQPEALSLGFPAAELTCPCQGWSFYWGDFSSSYCAASSRAIWGFQYDQPYDAPYENPIENHLPTTSWWQIDSFASSLASWALPPTIPQEWTRSFCVNSNITERMKELL